MKKNISFKWITSAIILIISLFTINPVNAMADGNIKVAAITGRKYEKSAGDKIIALFKKTRIPDYKNSGHIYTYSYSTDKKTLKKKSEQQKVVSNFYSTIDNAFSSSTDQDLNIFYYVGHGLPSQSKDNGYGGIPVGFFPGYGISSPSTDFERITYVQLMEALNKYHGKFIIIIDACISGSVIDAAKATLSSSDLNRYVFLTSTSNKKVAWGPKLSTSMNYTLTSKFQKADKNQDGCMSLAELYDYIIKKNGNFRLLQEPLLYTTNRGFFNDLPLFQFNYTKLSASSISVQKNSKKTLKVDIKGPKSIKHKVKYGSSNSNVASVNNKGCITGKSAGTAIISVYLTDKNGKECISTKSDCVVRVYEAASIKLNQSAISLYVKENTYLSAAVTGKNSKVTWKSSNTKVAAVNSNGKITGKKAGSCKVTATANGKKATCSVTVKNKQKKYSDIEKVSKMTAPKAAAALALNKRISNIHDVFYTRNGRTGDGLSYMWCSQINTSEKGMWTFYAEDSSISVYGAKVGMSKDALHNALSKKGWRKSSDIINNIMHTNTLGYDKGSYHIVVTVKYNKVTGMSYYNMESAW